jgi:hypothetical protein
MLKRGIFQRHGLQAEVAAAVLLMPEFRRGFLAAAMRIAAVR